MGLERCDRISRKRSFSFFLPLLGKKNSCKATEKRQVQHQSATTTTNNSTATNTLLDIVKPFILWHIRTLLPWKITFDLCPYGLRRWLDPPLNSSYPKILSSSQRAACDYRFDPDQSLWWTVTSKHWIWRHTKWNLTFWHLFWWASSLDLPLNMTGDGRDCRFDSLVTTGGVFFLSHQKRDREHSFWCVDWTHPRPSVHALRVTSECGIISPIPTVYEVSPLNVMDWTS